MSRSNTLVDLNDGTTVSNNSPKSPTAGTLLDNPITLDFDPMSFKFKEDSPLTSPSENGRELADALSPSQNIDVVDFFDPFCPVKEESPTDYYPNVMLDQATLGDPMNDHSPEFPPEEVSYPNYEVFRDHAVSVHPTTECQEEESISFNEQIKLHDTTPDLLSGTFHCVDNLIDTDEVDIVPEVLMLQSEETGEYDTAAIMETREFDLININRSRESDNASIEEPGESDMASVEETGECDNISVEEPRECDDASMEEPGELNAPVEETQNFNSILEGTRHFDTALETGELDSPEMEDNKHVIDQDEVFQHGDCLVTENGDFARRGKVTSVSSSVSSKSERSEKKSRKSSSTSSETSMREEERSAKSMKISKKDENIIHKTEISERKILEKGSPKKENIYQSHNGVEKANLKNGIHDNYIENEKIDLKDSPECPVSVTDLRSTYVYQTAQESPDVSPTKEIIDIGVDLKSLKSSYTQHAGEERDISPNREIISTGVDIKALKSNFTVAKDRNRSKGTEVIETGVSVRTLKSSFTKSDDESHLSNFQEEVKPSVDRAKVQRTFSQSVQDDQCLCKICGKHVYQMEKMKAEKNVFHKNCFRCKECNKLLNVDSYSSNEGDLYCKAHFKQLFQPKARFDGEDLAPIATYHADEYDSPEGKQRRNELIIRENVPAELPPDVIRSDSKPDHGLESLPVNLSNLKSKFEHKEDSHLPSTNDTCTLQRSASVLARLAKYQSAVSGESNENGNVTDSESEDECEDPGVIKSTKHKEKVVFSGMSSLKSQWETGSVTATKEERIEEKKEELNKLRQRMCLGRSESMKAVYEKACQDSSKGNNTPARPDPVDVGRDVRANRLKEKFEKGDVGEIDEEKMEKARREKEEELSIFTEPVMATDAKKLFKQIDATVKTTALSPHKSPSSEHKEHHGLISHNAANDAEVVKCSEPTAKEEIHVDTTDLSQRFKFFENYSEGPKEKKRFQMTPPREPAKEDSPDHDASHDPNIVRSVDTINDIPSTDTARRMLDKFKALEKESPSVPSGPKPLKRITPPREYTKDAHDSSPEPERDPNIIRSTYKSDDDIVVEADTTKSLRAKFENWDIESRENRRNEEEEEEDYLPQVDTTKTLRAKFEAIKEDTMKPLEKPKAKINRFVQEYSGGASEVCSICEKKVYPMEKMEASGMRLHKNCFRCAHCSCMLRLENYTTSGGRLYCTPHFKQLFISRGNYDEGFGREQHKDKWNRSCNNTPTPRDLQDNCDVVDYTNGDVPCLEQTV